MFYLTTCAPLMCVQLLWWPFLIIGMYYIMCIIYSTLDRETKWFVPAFWNDMIFLIIIDDIWLHWRFILCKINLLNALHCIQGSDKMYLDFLYFTVVNLYWLRKWIHIHLRSQYSYILYRWIEYWLRKYSKKKLIFAKSVFNSTV